MAVKKTPENKAIEEFRKIYLKNYGRDLSYKEAQRRAVKLINVFQAIYKPIRK